MYQYENKETLMSNVSRDSYRSYEILKKSNSVGRFYVKELQTSTHPSLYFRIYNNRYLWDYETAPGENYKILNPSWAEYVGQYIKVAVTRMIQKDLQRIRTGSIKPKIPYFR